MISIVENKNSEKKGELCFKCEILGPHGRGVFWMEEGTRVVREKLKCSFHLEFFRAM